MEPSTGGAHDTGLKGHGIRKGALEGRTPTAVEKEAMKSASYRKKGAGGGKVGVGCSRINVVLLKEEERQLYP